VTEAFWGTLEGFQAKKPKHVWQPIYARAVREGIWMAIVCVGCSGVQIYREDFVGIQIAICGLVGGLTEEGFTTRILDSYWAKRGRHYDVPS
jgi:hypothetical protein